MFRSCQPGGKPPSAHRDRSRQYSLILPLASKFPGVFRGSSSKAFSALSRPRTSFPFSNTNRRRLAYQGLSGNRDSAPNSNSSLALAIHVHLQYIHHITHASGRTRGFVALCKNCIIIIISPTFAPHLPVALSSPVSTWSSNESVCISAPTYNRNSQGCIMTTLLVAF